MIPLSVLREYMPKLKDEDLKELGPVEYDQSKVPEVSKKHAENVRRKVYLPDMTESFARGVEYAGLIASDAVGISNETKGRQDSVETQFNAVQQEMTGKDVISAPELIAARGGEPTLSDRLDKEQQEVTAQLAQTANFNKAKFYKNPIDEPFPISLSVYKDNSGKVITDMHNINELMNMSTTDTGVFYAAPYPFGSTSNDGLTPETPTTLAKAVLMEEVHTIFLRRGLYNREGIGGLAGTLTHDKIKLIAYQDEQVLLGNSNNYVNWKQHSPNVYKVDRNGTVGVYDSAIFDKYGNDYKYTKVGSINELNSIEGSWYTDNVSVYVRTLDGRVPDDKIKLSIGGNNIKINNSSGKYYFEGITFENGANGMLVESTNIVYFKNCHFRNSLDKAIDFAGGTNIAILEDCRAYGSQTNDGISYRDGVAYFLEINCLGFDNGKESNIDNNNGSTSHGLTGYGIRVNGIYFDNKGPNVADVFGANNTSLIWNVGCTAYGSASSSDGGSCDFITTDKTYWEDCVSYGSVNSFASTEKTSYIRNSIYEEQPNGLIVPY